MKTNRETGLGIVEAMIVTVILLSLGGSLIGAVSSLKQFTSTTSAKQRLQKMGEAALNRIIRDMKRSGVVTIGTKDYPYLFVDGGASGDFSIHEHTPATHAASDTDSDYGSDREIVFVLPIDEDGNGVPDTDGAGNLAWVPSSASVTEFSYVLNTDSKGINRLERRTNAGSPEWIASHVERITFDMNATDVSLPLYSVRVRIYFRMTDNDGSLCRHMVETTVKLWNTST